MGSSMNPHSATVEMETRLQFSSNYYQSNTLLFTAAFSFKKAIILEKSGLLPAHMHSRKPEQSVLPLSSQLRTKPNKNCGKGAPDFNPIPFLRHSN